MGLLDRIDDFVSIILSCPWQIKQIDSVGIVMFGVGVFRAAVAVGGNLK